MKIGIISAVWTALFAVAVPSLEAQAPAETQEPAVEVTAAAATAEAAEVVQVAEVTKVPLFENLGEYHYPITAASERVQRYFNQGLRLVYGFNHSEAIRSFQEAARIDPTCAMAHWGIALALGPNINAPMSPEAGKAAYQAIQQAVTLARHASQRERAYIETLATRYAADPETADRLALDQAYADAMRELSQRYPSDLDAATLFATSLMNVRPWDYWTPDSQPKPGTLELVAALEGVLEKDLALNPNNGWSLYGLAQSLHAQGKSQEATAVEEQFKKAWAKADVELAASRF